ncbi:PAS domain-containing hybrid sensor histidine kinase/response regulator [Phenylobacterium sp.]|uniref:PAS domain-containing hybrid sensor histidine kinase/response regulator n=1 Tax=Phenylobacterium sp. TaxID=1871053 RepID=UPI00272F1A54|nr:ATP-binding protein [Phenylobacterium sp.]MDP1874496.1 response regulator [Phenylobacterium sp.]
MIENNLIPAQGPIPMLDETSPVDVEAMVRHLARSQKLSGTGSWEWRVETDELFCSEQFYHVYGVSEKEFKPTFQTFLDLVHPHDRDKMQEAVERAVLKHEPYCIDHRIILPGGNLRSVQTQADVDLDPDGSLVGLFGVVRDVTQQRNIENDARTTTEMLASMLRISPEAIIFTDPAGCILQFSAGAENVFGYAAREVIGRSVGMLIGEGVRAEHARHVQNFAEGRRKSLRMGDRAPVHGRRKSGGQFPAEASLAKLETAGGLAFVSVVRDLSEVRAAEARLTEAREAAERANLAKSSFLANMSHEIRTPLNGVLGVAGALARTAMHPKQREMVQLIETSGRALEGLLSDILDLAKIDAGRMALRLEPFDLEQLVTDTIALFQASAAQKGVELRLEATDRNCGHFLGDDLKIRQVLSNLLSNAVKFTDRGEVVLSLSEVAHDEIGCQIRFKVQDTGIGFPEEVASTLFERFEQADGTITRRFGGTGLGLAISKSLVELMGGSLSATSISNVGSTFEFDLVLERAGSEIPLRAELGDAAEFEWTRNLRVLLAEDHPINRKTVQMILDGLPVEIVSVENGEQAVRTVEAGNFDLILMDMQMPVMDGLTAIKLIREYELNCQNNPTPICVLTANAMPEHRELAVQAGANDFLTKPINAGDLISLVCDVAASVQVRQQ